MSENQPNGKFKVCLDLKEGESCELLSRKTFQEDAKRRLQSINTEFEQTFDFLEKFPKSVSFFGSARFPEDHTYYKKAEKIAGMLCGEGYAVVTGGGPGIMEAGNRGSKETCGHSVGLNIQLPNGQKINKYVTHGLGYHYFFSRKVALAFSAEAFVFFPGGFGTLDEFFEMVTLIQTRKIQKIPLICVGSHFWGKVQEMIEEVLYKDYKTIDLVDMDIYHITDTEEDVLNIIKRAPLRDE